MQNAVELGNGTWTALQQVCFNVSGNPENLTNFCPELIWDLQSDGSNGGFFPGNEGLVITLLEDGASSVADEDPIHYNWQFSGSISPPYGNFVQGSAGCYTSSCVICRSHEDAPRIKIP